MKKTNVLFLIEKDGEDTFAYFPDELSHTQAIHGKLIKFKTCYAHIGQHSACHPDYAKECKEASYREYQDLLKELIGRGYKSLNILNKQDVMMDRQPTEGEIKFGEGAVHYRTFNLAEIIDRKGNLKKWIKADDGLRYYRG